MGVMAQAMWLAEEERLKALTSRAPLVSIDGRQYRRLSQPSSAVYSGRWGAHVVEEPLYRAVDQRNGPTVKPLDLRVGVVGDRLLPDCAHAVGYLSGLMTSREVETTLATLGFTPPSRTTIYGAMMGIGEALVANAEALHETVLADEQVSENVAGVTVGLDRMAVLIDEALEGDARAAALRRRDGRTYERTPAEPHARAWRMAWVGSLTLLDPEGAAIKTIRHGIPPCDDPSQVAARLVDEVCHVVTQVPRVKVVCVQDGARDLDVLRTELRRRLPEGVERHHLVDIQHLLGYLGDVVTACQPAGDPNNVLDWYRAKLLTDDGAIDDIFRGLRRQAKGLARTATAQRAALAAAITYIRTRRKLMRYASVAAANLAVGSGATESACAVFQLRVKRPGMHWQPDGLRPVMAIRGIVSSGRWDLSWSHLASWHRANVCVRPTAS
jgi:hypothetical protein